MAELERLRREMGEYSMLVGRMSRLLTGVADGLRGPKELVMRDWSGLPEDAAEIREIVREALDSGEYESGIRKLALFLELI